MNIITQQLWKWLKRDFLKLHHNDLVRKAAEAGYNMEYAYTDKAGNSYQRFTGTNLPIERTGKMQDFIELMSSGLSDDQLDELIAVADNELALAMSGKKSDPKKVGWVLTEIQNRRHIILHTELLYNFLAIQYVREDEPISQYVESIHQQKVDQFKIDNADERTYFFFQVPELKLVNEFLKLSENEWNEFWQDSLRTQQLTKKRLEALARWKKSLPATRTPAAT